MGKSKVTKQGILDLGYSPKSKNPRRHLCAEDGHMWGDWDDSSPYTMTRTRRCRLCDEVESRG